MQDMAMTQERLDKLLTSRELVYHHTAAHRGYVSRKVDGLASDYDGSFGHGITYDTPRWDTTRYFYRTYYVKEAL